MPNNLNYRQNLLVVLMEECSEVTKCVSKMLRFGKKASHPKHKMNNENELIEEYYQLQATFEELQRLGYIKTIEDKSIQKIKENKINKINHFYNLNEK